MSGVVRIAGYWPWALRQPLFWRSALLALPLLLLALVVAGMRKLCHVIAKPVMMVRAGEIRARSMLAYKAWRALKSAEDRGARICDQIMARWREAKLNRWKGLRP